jgi:hypothetical protein
LTSAVERKSTQTMVSVSLARSRCLSAMIRTTATQETLRKSLAGPFVCEALKAKHTLNHRRKRPSARF